MSNFELKTRARVAGVRMYQVAEAMGIAETTLCRRLRRDLSEEERNRIIEAIDQLAKGGADAEHSENAKY